MKKTVCVFMIIEICFTRLHSQVPPEFLIHCAHENPGNVFVMNLNKSNCSNISLSNRLFDTKFIPAPNSTVHYVHVNQIFLQMNDGSGSFQENDPEHNAILDGLEAEINYTYANLIMTHDPSCYKGPGTESISDTRIQFTFDRYYIRYEKGRDNKNGNLCPDVVPWYLDSLDNAIVNNLNIKRGINVYYTEWGQNYMDLVVNRTKDTNDATGSACSQFPSFIDYQRSSRVHMPNLYTKYWHMKNIAPQEFNQPWDPVIKGWYLGPTARGIAHELGHSLWLSHESPPHYVTNGCFNSLMNQAGNSPHNFLPPSEVGRMHASLSLSNIRTFVSNNMYNTVPFIVSYIDNWNMETRLYQDLNIVSGGNLTISCKLEMAKNANISVKTGGILTIDGGIIGTFSDTWNGSVTVESGGSLIMKNGAVLEKCLGGFYVARNATFKLSEGEPESKSMQRLKRL